MLVFTVLYQQNSKQNKCTLLTSVGSVDLLIDQRYLRGPLQNRPTLFSLHVIILLPRRWQHSPTNYNKMFRQNGCFWLLFFSNSLKVRKVTVQHVILERIHFHEIISLGGKRKGSVNRNGS